jgi:hypothetical protein
MQERLEALLDRELQARGLNEFAHVDELAEAIRQHFRERLDAMPRQALTKYEISAALGLQR